MTFHRKRAAGFALGAVAAAMPLLAQAGITLYEEGAKSLEIGGRLQVQYQNVDPDTSGADSTDDLFLRRMRVYVEGTLTEDIMGIWQVDFGSNGEDAETKDAYIAYSGYDFGEIVVGNQYVPFSRENLTSSKRQQLVERTLAGDHNFGVPDRQIGLLVHGGSDIVTWAIGGFKAGIDGSTSKIDFESPVSQPDDDENFYVGNLVGARLDFTPFGKFKYAQGAFGSDLKVGIAVNAYSWSNDDDAPDPDGDAIGDEYDEVTGYGIDAALRLGYFSADAAYQIFQAETVDGAVSDGLIEDGEAEFDTWLLKAGYMVIPNKLETVVSYSGLDADAFAEEDTRLAFGLNWFINQHDDKIQLAYEIGSDVIAPDGETVVGDDQNVLFLQFQHVL